MNILWLSNVIFPEACQELNIVPPIVGGWMYSGAQALLNEHTGIRLGVVSLYEGTELKLIKKYRVQYFLVPSGGKNQKYNSALEFWFRRVKEEFKPDLVHIHGTEYPHSLAWVKACGNKNVVVSIQGLVHIYANHYLGGIPIKQIKANKTLRDILRKDSLLHQQEKMKKRGEYEKELISRVNHIIGRTSWDKSNTWAINSKAVYHFCDESLRDGFYKDQWRYENCEQHSLFLSQAHYPIKGIQQVVKALPVVMKHFPNVKVYVAGPNFLKFPLYRRNGFANYLLKQMEGETILNKFIFLGTLSEEEMIKQYLNAHVFVCPSAIENSPNSIGEAQLLGTPCVASYVGGTMDMVKDGETGLLYRFEETNMLAMRICELFANRELAEERSKQGRIAAAKRHNKKKNAKTLLQIYKSVIDEGLSDI